MASEARRAAAEAAKERGNAAFRNGAYADAVGAYTEAILADPSEAVYRLNRSMAYLKLNKFNDALSDADRAVALQPSKAKAHFRRGTARRGVGQLKEALQDFERVLRLDPGNQQAQEEIRALKAQLAADESKSRRKVPLDLPAPPQSSLPTSADPSPDSPKSGDALAGAQSGIGDVREKSEDPGDSRPRNPVEAARRFLENVGMGDQSPRVTKQGFPAGPSASFSSTTTAKPLPARLPGEPGAFLKEVSSRRINREGAASVTTHEPVPPPGVGAAVNLTASTSTDTDSTAATRTTEAAPRAIKAGSTAAQLRLGADDTPTSAGHYGQTHIGAASAPKLRLSALEFERRWKQAGVRPPSSHSVGAPNSEVDIDDGLEWRRMAFLETVDVESLPETLGPLLSPELLGSIVRCLWWTMTVNPARCANVEVRSTAKTTSTARRVVEALPRCERFGTALALLDDNERQAIPPLIASLYNDAQQGPGEDLRRAWSV